MLDELEGEAARVIVYSAAGDLVRAGRTFGYWGGKWNGGKSPRCLSQVLVPQPRGYRQKPGSLFQEGFCETLACPAPLHCPGDEK